MATDKIKKYVIPNIPYIMIFVIALWATPKIPVDLPVPDGITALIVVVIFWIVVHFKVKNAKKFRKDVEYGSARWGTQKDIKPFVDPVFKNNVILTGTEFLTINTRPKNPANARNLNCCVIGSSGSGKTRFWLTPQLLQAHSSYVVVDPKGVRPDRV